MDPLIRGLGHSRCAASVRNRGGDVPTSGVVVRAVGPGVANVGVSGVRLGEFGEVGLVDRLGRAGVARCDKVRLPILQWLPCPGAPELRCRSTRCQELYW